jgi:hypothetical protein
MVVIRRELPRTSVAGPATGLSRSVHEDPPRRALRSLSSATHGLGHAMWCCGLPYAAHRPGNGMVRSTSTPIAQMNPKSSRATAVTTCGAGLSFATSRR